MSMIPKATLLAIEERLSSTKVENVLIPRGLFCLLIDALKETSAANEELADELDRLRRVSCQRRCGGMG